MNTKKLSKSQRVKEAVLHSPLLIPLYLKDNSFNNSLIYKQLKQLIPFRVGVELECGGSLCKTVHDLKSFWTSDFKAKNKIKEKYNLIDFDIDNEYDGMTEHKISFDYKSLKGFYLILEEMKKECTVNTKGACHIHINNLYHHDILDYIYTERIGSDSRRRHIIKKLEVYLDKINLIFGEYEGSYNPKKATISNKDGWLCVRNMGTYEFRIGKCNFDYETIISWIIQCSSLVKEFNNIMKNIVQTNKNI